MKIFLKFAYTGCISWKNVDNLFEFLKDADFLGLDDVREEGIKLFLPHVNQINAIEAYHFSERCRNKLLKQKCRQVILRDFAIISRTGEFLDLSSDALKDILSSDPFISCTQSKLKSILKWVERDLDSRRLHLMDIFGLINFGHADITTIIKMSGEHK